MKCRSSATLLASADNAVIRRRKYGRVEMVGPFSVRDGEDNYQLYLIARRVPSPILSTCCLTVRFCSLIVTMLVSSPLLLWLAWSLRNRRVS